MAQVKNDFSQGSIPRNILSLALPMTAAQLVNVLYSVVDRIYLGRLPGSSHLRSPGWELLSPSCLSSWGWPISAVPEAVRCVPSIGEKEMRKKRRM